MRPVQNEGKYGTGPSAGKSATGVKRGKTCNRCQARENMRPVPSAGKHVRLVTTGFE